MSMQAKLMTIADTLGTIQGLKVSHYDYFGTAETYCVWAEDQEQASVEGDNYKLEQAIQGTIDLYTKTEFDTFVDSIQAALKAAKISFYLNSVQYEQETDFIHYEWVFSV